MKKTLLGTVIIAVLTATGPAQATVIFDFIDGNPLDGAPVGDSFTTNGLTLTTTELTDWRGDLGSTNSAIVLNSSGDNLGVNSPSPNPPNATQDFRDFDPGESWTFTFSQPVTIDFMNVASIDSPAEMTISSTAFATQVIGADDWAGDDIDFATLLGGAVISAGTEVTIKNTSAESIPGGGANSHDWRIQELHVTVIPEPATISLVGLSLAILICVRRSRRA